MGSALETAKEGDTGEGPVLGSSSVELTAKEVREIETALQDTNRVTPNDSNYPSGVYFEYGDRFVVVDFRMYD